MPENSLIAAMRYNVAEKEVVIDRLIEDNMRLEMQVHDLKAQLKTWIILWQNRKEG